MAGVIQGFFRNGRFSLPVRHHQPVQARSIQASPNSSAFALPPALLDLRPSAAGRPLPEAVQRKMESFFGADFSDVRVHVGQEAASIGALAFTCGSNLYFAPGQYEPGTPHGQRLLGHELAHVLQQRAGRVRNPFGAGVAVVQDLGLEAEAERMGVRVAMAPAPPPPVQAKLQPGGLRLPTVQRMVVGIANPMSHGEALGNTGGDQTTVCEAKINGSYIGKFDNRASFMNKGAVIKASNIGTYFPSAYCKKYYELGTGAHANGKPHAEDFLMAALRHEYERLGGNWTAEYPRAPGQNFDLLSIKIDKSPCPNCARNLLKLTAQYGLEMRVKASVLHTATNSKGLTGAQMLDAGKYGNAGVPVRHWTVAKLENYIENKLGKMVTESEAVETYRAKNNASTGTFPLGAEAEKDWSAMGFGRKAGRGNW